MTPDDWKTLKRLFESMPLSDFIEYLRKEGFSEEEIEEILRVLGPKKPLIIPDPTTDPRPDYVPDPCD